MAVTVTFAPSSYMGTADDRDAQSAILTVSATASDQASVSYSISDGNGQGYFVIDAATGALTLGGSQCGGCAVGSVRADGYRHRRHCQRHRHRRC